MRPTLGKCLGENERMAEIGGGQPALDVRVWVHAAAKPAGGKRQDIGEADTGH